MAFSDFQKISQVQEQFGIKYAANDFFKVEAVNPSPQFMQELAFSLQHIHVLSSEAARCEAIIFPILREVYKRYADNYVLYIREPITYDETLSGTTDYLIKSSATKPPCFSWGM